MPLDSATNAVLDTRSLSNFSGGAYVVWKITGHVKLRVTQMSSGPNSVVSGIFFGAGAVVGPLVTFSGVDTATQGNWKSKYGADGYTVIDDSAKSPTYATIAPSLAADYVWSNSTTDVRALQKGSSTDRIASTWYSPSVFYVDLNITDQLPHPVAVYCVDWDYMGRSQTVEVLDANTNAVLDTRALTSFSGGVYLTWNITGHVKLRFTQTSSAPNAVVSGIFFGAGVTIAATGVAATFVTTDTVTQGNWQSKYGADGFLVVDDSVSNPSYASVHRPAHSTTI